ncbi:hypothetical protein MMMDOFMJ_1396 [Methylobacterium gnaphalii]|uniref:Uncharacterized protein n=2 Tax=Methylobacterium gnaphalii TaxID=1010610 RepID=A0A512JPN9_9HYPH|nr:hypothetical protein MGN01_37520 [Methylobacterium gnaphalii]GJD68473.1 hypothetical protein MMMDOFMJ_1396 [Methylobacterium gnaphalii]GLS51494.1 hypothetical protein GCM10007885_43510 [Methylobacterium gnaphalii]
MAAHAADPLPGDATYAGAVTVPAFGRWGQLAIAVLKPWRARVVARSAEA